MTSPGDWRPSSIYPDPAIEVFHPSFASLCIFSSAVEQLATGTRWGEGPVYFSDARHLLWSDIPNDRILKWDEASGNVSVYRQPCNHANGATRDLQGRLISCEHGGRVTRTEYDGRITVLADSFEGKRLNSPNDVVVKSDGTIWFTDPNFGLLNDYEGSIAEQELTQNVYRLDPVDGSITAVLREVHGPNGLCFSPDERTLYVAESRATPNRLIVAYDVVEQRSIANRRVFVDAGPGTPDGFCCDVHGNLWCGWGMGKPELDGVMVFDSEGTLIGRIRLPERCSNVTFGGRHMNRLFMTCGHALYALYVNTRGA